MIDFEFTEEQRSAQDMAHEFAERELRPIALECDAAHAFPPDLLPKACWHLDRGLDAGLWGSYAKCFASDVAMRVTTDAVQVLGGYGVMHEYQVETWMRDAKVLQIVEGTNQIQRLIVNDYQARAAARKAPATRS